MPRPSRRSSRQRPPAPLTTTTAVNRCPSFGGLLDGPIDPRRLLSPPARPLPSCVHERPGLAYATSNSYAWSLSHLFLTQGLGCAHIINIHSIPAGLAGCYNLLLSVHLVLTGSMIIPHGTRFGSVEVPCIASSPSLHVSIGRWTAYSRNFSLTEFLILHLYSFLSSRVPSHNAQMTRLMQIDDI